MHCSDYELLTVPRPKLEFGIHVTFKTVQLGTVAGSLLVGPLLHILRQGASNHSGRQSLSDAAVQGGLYGAGLGLLAGPLLSIGYYNTTLSKIANYDQCYRLRYNMPQLTVDRISLAAALIGGGLAGAPGFVAGVDVGVLCAVLLNGLQSVRLQI